MKYRFFIFTGLIIISGALSAGESDVEKFRKHYRQVQGRIKDKSLVCSEIIFNRNNYQMPAVGTSTRIMRAYFNMEPPENGNCDMYPVKIDYEVQIAAMKWKYEYLFDRKGNPVFIYLRKEWTGEPFEERMYFRGETMIRFMRGREILSKFTSLDKKKAAARLSAARKLHDMAGKTLVMPVETMDE